MNAKRPCMLVVCRGAFVVAWPSWGSAPLPFSSMTSKKVVVQGPGSDRERTIAEYEASEIEVDNGFLQVLSGERVIAIHAPSTWGIAKVVENK